jgi:hypothetical protein
MCNVKVNGLKLILVRRPCCVPWTGTNLQTGEEVGIKLVRAPLSLLMSQRRTSFVPISSAAKCIATLSCSSGSGQCSALLNSCCPLLLLQESVKARHPQLLYESKLYKILQGGGKQRLPAWLTCTAVAAEQQPS